MYLGEHQGEERRVRDASAAGGGSLAAQHGGQVRPGRGGPGDPPRPQRQ